VKKESYVFTYVLQVIVNDIIDLLSIDALLAKIIATVQGAENPRV